MLITLIKRMYLIFILLPVAIIYAGVIMFITIIQHLITQSKIPKY
jgi:hypothetical protein